MLTSALLIRTGTRLRIVFVLPHANFTGGVRTVATYARLLSRRGHEVTIVSTPDLLPPIKARVKSLLRGRGWPRQPREERSLIDHAQVEHRRLSRFRPVEDRDVPDADVVIATWWLTVEWVAALSARKGAKVHFVQGDDADVPGQPRERVAATWRLPLHRVVCSRWLLELSRERSGNLTASLVPNGVDLDLFSAPPRDRQARPTVGLVYNEPWIKGCDVAVAAFQSAARRLSGLRLIAFGNMPVSPSMPLPPGTEFTLLPAENEIPRLYAACDAWLWPSRREGFGLPILEAMACRTPVIAAPAGAAPEILGRGGGVLLPSADPEGMADAIERILTLRASEWGHLSEQARSVAAMHGWDASVRLLETALEIAASTAPPLSVSLRRS